jgi:hypothetical protein
VYLRQHAQQQTPEPDGTGSQQLEPARLPGTDVLARQETCVVLAGPPGGGKSSLLRTWLAASVERWQYGLADTVVPVLVSAPALVGMPLLEAVATAVSAELGSFGLPEDLPVTFFRTPPRPGVSWLFLVDGLDEITASEARRQLLSELQAIQADQHTLAFRFVVATRPLPQGELDMLGTAVPRYQLEPFAPEDVVCPAVGPAIQQESRGGLGRRVQWQCAWCGVWCHARTRIGHGYPVSAGYSRTYPDETRSAPVRVIGGQQRRALLRARRGSRRFRSPKAAGDRNLRVRG